MAREVEKDELQRAVGTRYTVISEIGHGSIGTVYSATERSTNRAVAIKAIPSDDEYTTERFSKEVRVLSTLKHPNIVSLVGHGVTEGLLYLVTPLVRGTTLQQLLKREKTLSIDHALAVATAIAAALEAAHSSGVIHRDIAPGNVFIPHGGEGPQYDGALVADFGAVAITHKKRLTSGGLVVGTPRYMAPEQVAGQPLSPATDIFSLGVILYEMIFGASPFEGQDYFSLGIAILGKDVTIPDSPPLSSALRHFLLDCLSKKPAERPENAHTVLRTIISRSAEIPTGDGKEKALLPGHSRDFRYPWIHVWVVLLAVSILLIAFSLVFSLFKPLPGHDYLPGVAAGVALALGGVLIGLLLGAWFRKRAGGRRREASRLLYGLETRADLSRTLFVEMRDLVNRCRALDERILGKTMLLMVDEYQRASDLDDRTKALVTAVEFLEKLTTRLSPWYIKYEKLVVALVSILGLITGGLQIAKTLTQT